MGKQFNPLFIALYACKNLHLESITGPILVPDLKELNDAQYVTTAMDWLVAEQKQHGRFSVWENDFPYTNYALQAPWRCALAEAFGSLVLLTVGKTSDARRHLESLITDYRDGGVGYLEGDFVWFLEYVCEERPLVLNGMLHCLIILHYCNIRLKDPVLEKAFQYGYETLKRNLRLFDAGFYTYYDSKMNPADEKYHKLHVELLRLLYKQTNDPELLPWIEKWSGYERMYSLAEPLIFLCHLLHSRGRLYT